MEAEAHLAELAKKHRHLDHMIEEEMAHPAADDLKIGELKRRKLRLKEQIERIRAEGIH